MRERQSAARIVDRNCRQKILGQTIRQCADDVPAYARYALSERRELQRGDQPDKRRREVLAALLQERTTEGPPPPYFCAGSGVPLARIVERAEEPASTSARA